MIDKLLNNYKNNKANIELLKIKINQWCDILNMSSEEIVELYSKPKEDKLGVQSTRILNPIESMIIKAEDQKEKIKNLILDSNNKIKMLEQENKIVDILLETLDEESKFIIIQKCFERKKWNIITFQFNSNYRNEYKEFITSSGIRKKFSGIKKELMHILEDIMQKK